MPKKGSSSKLQQKSPAAFFSENKAIAGFENDGKSMYTTIREFVENSLDAAEHIGVLPDIQVELEEVTREEFNAMVGVDKSRVDETLYEDYQEAQKLKKKNAKRKSQGKEALDKEDGKSSSSRSSARNFIRVSVRDNGCGMPHDDIPNMLGIVLSGTKYGVRQTRGKFGLGAKMALIWSKMSTGLPITIESAREGHRITHCSLDIDIYKNRPNVLVHEKRDNPEGWRGTRVSVVIKGNWSAYKSRVLKYMRQMAIITPYAEFSLSYTASDPKKSFSLRFARRSDVMPPVPTEAKHHPSSVNLILIKKLISEHHKRKLAKFLTTAFCSITSKHAERLIAELGDDVDASTKVGDLSEASIVKLSQVFQDVVFPPPDGKCLSPAGEYNLRLGILKELMPDLVATSEGTVCVAEGHPFIVDVGIAIGGAMLKPGISVYRFANRIPMLFEGGSDVATKTAYNKISWSRYKINKSTDKVGVFVSIVSTKIPFKGTSKEYIGDSEPIAAAIKKSIEKCAQQLKVKIMQQMALKSQQTRKRTMMQYVPTVARAIEGVLAVASENQNKRQRLNNYPTAFDGLSEIQQQTLASVREGHVTFDTLSAKLTELLDRADAEESLKYAAEAGRSDTNMLDVSVAPMPEDVPMITFKGESATFSLIESTLELPDA